MARIKSLSSVVVPFRAPEITRRIEVFPRRLLDYHDEDMRVADRFSLIDAFLDKFPLWSGDDLDGFVPYPVNGSTEAIAAAMRELMRTGRTAVTVDGEYRYYRYLCDSLSIPHRTATMPDDLRSGDVFITSIPFCRSGGASELQLELLRRCHVENIECWLDRAYLGTGTDVAFDRPSSTTNIFYTFSKNFALGLQRIGVWYSRWHMPDRQVVLDCGYTNLGMLALVTDLMEHFPRGWLHETYKGLQMSCTSTPTNIVYMDAYGCITDRMLARLAREDS